jgi:hypothetical protein
MRKSTAINQNIKSFLKTYIQMKKDVVRKIRMAAAQLPPLYEMRTVRENGADIIDRVGQDAKDGAGKPISKKLTYTFKKAFVINHEQKMKDIYQRAPKGLGHDHVLQYCEAVVNQAEKQAKKAEKQLENLSV